MTTVDRTGVTLTRIVVAAAVVICAAAVLAVPGSREALLEEDGPIESATAILYLVAVVFGVRMARRSGDRILWVVPLFALAGFLDEVSFGTRLFGLSTPTILDVEFDSLHDVVDVADHALAAAGIGRTAAAVAVMTFGALVVALLVATGQALRIVAWLRHRPQITKLLVALGLLGVAVILDQIATTNTVRFAEETLEFAAAGLVLHAALGTRRSAPAEVSS